jgi:eukaryotic-like serine/threonine-protein kinase
MIGSMVGPYRVVERLGAGGMGEVYLGLDSRLQRKVALKSLTSPVIADDDRREQILREARAAARLNHPGIAAVYDVVEQGDRAYIVMEYIEGQSLAARLAQGPLPMDRTFAIGLELAAALSAAHAGGVVHHDLKPANIQLTAQGSVKVLDFGVARVTTPAAMPTETTRSVASVLSPGDGYSGTLAYMAPEQLLSKPVDARSDIYSLGVVLFEMATGKRPFDDTDPISLAVAMSNAPAPTADSLNPQVPRALAAVIARALEARPEKRYQSAQELEAALADASALTGARAIWRRVRVPAGVALLLLVLAGGATLLIRNRLGPAPPARPTILAILPVDNPSGDPQAEYLGAGFASVLSSNLAAVTGLTVLSRESTAPYAKARSDLASLGRDLGVDLILDLSIRAVRPSPVLVVRLRQANSSPAIWEDTLTGDALAVERALMNGAGNALERSTGRTLTKADWKHIRAFPTTNSEALSEYSEARALLDRFDVPGNIDRALTLLAHAIGDDGRFVMAQAALGDAYWMKYQRDKDVSLASAATDAVMKALQIDPEQAPVLYSLGNMQYVTGRYEDATESLRHSLKIQPDNDEAHRLLGLVLAERGDLNAAVLEVQQAIRIRPLYWRNHTTLGYIYYRAGRYQDALAPYRRATELQPTNANVFSSLGLMYHRLGRVNGRASDIDQAIGYYEHAVRLGPNPAAYANLALAYYDAKRYREALSTYQEALRTDPMSVENIRNIADVYLRLGESQKARAEYERAISIGEDLLKVNNRDYRTIILMAVCESHIGRAASAEGHAAEAKVLAPTDQETLQYSAEIHTRLGQTDAALKDLEAAINNGYSRREARTNEELEPLRQLPLFQRLIAEH